jgi:hypothetical protein
VTAPDRTVHGLNAAGDAEVVRYDRAGRWYVEPLDGGKRRNVGVRDAARIVAGGTHHPGRSGGMMLDAIVRGER